jgi:AcrR family transcriptional regulator
VTLRAPEAAAKPGVEDTRLRILAAARKMYAERGSRGATTRDVAESAGVNEATLFRHFGTKQQLLSAMLDHYSERSTFISIFERLREISGLEAQLCLLGSEAIESLRRKEDLIKASMAEEISNPEAGLCAWRAPVEGRRLLTEFMRQKVDAGELRGDPESLARIFMSLFFAYVMAARLWHEEERPGDVVTQTIVDTFLNGARPR